MKKFSSLVIFSVAFALVEATVVIYLRQLMGINNYPYQIENQKVVLNLGVITFLGYSSKLFPNLNLLRVETIREAATIVMLISVAFIITRKNIRRLGAFLVAFSIWDIFYYVFLYLLIGWPSSLLDIDVFFLIPNVWTGPVITALVSSFAMLTVGIYLYFK